MRIRSLVPAALIAIASCGGSTEPGTTPTVTPLYTLSLASSTTSIVAGQSGTVNLTLARTSFTATVALAVTGLPSGATASFAPNPAQDASVLTINTGTAVAGTYNLLVTGTAAGLSDRTASLALTITAAPVPGYTMALSPGAASVQQGSTTPVTVTLTRTSFTGNVNLAVAGLPTGATSSVATNPVTGTSATITLGGGTATPGTYSLTVTGTATGLADRTAPFALTITAGPVTTTSVTLLNTAFNPPDIRVSPSAVVTWTNQDAVNHNVTFSDASIGTTGNFSSGAKTLAMPSAPGTYNYRCTIHAGMSGTVQVQ